MLTGLVVTTSILVELIPSGGDADLAITSPLTCHVVVCASSAGGTATESCTVTPGMWDVVVTCFWSPTGAVPYTLHLT